MLYLYNEPHVLPQKLIKKILFKKFQALTSTEPNFRDKKYYGETECQCRNLSYLFKKNRPLKTGFQSLCPFND